MKKLYFSLLLLFAATLAWADIPAGKTIYLDVSQHWCCHKSYYLFVNHNGNKNYRMSPDPERAGVYQYVTTGRIPSEVRFMYRDDRTDPYNTDWLGLGNNEAQPSSHWSESTPYYIIDSENGKSGHWAAAPSSTGKNTLGDVQANFIYNCATKDYNIDLYIPFDGAPCGLLISSPAMSKPKKTGRPRSPYQYVIEGITATEGQTVEVTISLCSDVTCTEPIESRTFQLTVPAKGNCENTQTITVCKGEQTTLTASIDAEVYLWHSDDPNIDSLTTRSVTIPTENVGTYSYSVEAYKTIVTAEQNLMVGGDFETINGFVSDYQYAGTFEAGTYADYYSKAPTSMKSNIFALVGNTADFWNLFESIDPHSGNYFGLFDAGKDGYAWQAFTDYPSDITKSNDNLIILKDSIYYFSYSVAHPNVPAESKSPAILQFVISYDGGKTVEPLSDPDTVSTADYEWYERHITWKAEKTSLNVMIGVRNLNKNDGVGNDFCLDDIMFQSVSYASSKRAFTDIFDVIVKNCEDCPDITPTQKDTTVCADEMPFTWHGHTFNTAGKWTETVISQVTGCDSLITHYTLNTNDCTIPCPDVTTTMLDTTVCLEEMPYTWYGHKFNTTADTFRDTLRNAQNCDSIITVYSLQTKDCTIPCEIQIYRKWNDFLFVDNSDSIYTSFQWYYEQTAIEGATEQYYRVPDPATQTGEFYVLLNGSIETCPTTISNATPSAPLYPAGKSKTLVSKRVYVPLANFTIIVYTYDDGTIETEKQLRY